jgi:beta-lactamase class A
MLVEKIYNKEIVSDSASIRMMRVLSRNYWDSHAISAIPPTIQVFSKNGAVDASRSEVLLVNVPGRPYVFCVTTKNNKDQSWTPTNEAWQLIEKISAVLWNHYR